MYRAILIAVLLIPQLAVADIFICTDPNTGQKSFTDKACPKLTAGKKVKVVPTNFGGGVHRKAGAQTWNSDLDTSVSGVSNLKRSSINLSHKK